MKKKAASIAEKEKDINDVNMNIEGFKQTKEQLLKKLTFLSGDNAHKKNYKA